jgi:hypothetical protein
MALISRLTDGDSLILPDGRRVLRDLDGTIIMFGDPDPDAVYDPDN